MKMRRQLTGWSKLHLCKNKETTSHTRASIK